MKIVVDADAVPKSVLEICCWASVQFSLPLWTVASFNHNIVPYHIHLHTHRVVGNASQETDIQIMNICTPGDIVVTQDYGLAAMVLGKGAKALSPHGRIFTQHTIGFLLEEREIKARYRRVGGKTKGPKKRSLGDDKKFKAALRQLLGK